MPRAARASARSRSYKLPAAASATAGWAGRPGARVLNRPFHHWRPRTKGKLCFIKATSGLWRPGRRRQQRLGTGRQGLPRPHPSPAPPLWPPGRTAPSGETAPTRGLGSLRPWQGKPTLAPQIPRHRWAWLGGAGPVHRVGCGALGEPSPPPRAVSSLQRLDLDLDGPGVGRKEGGPALGRGASLSLWGHTQAGLWAAPGGLLPTPGCPSSGSWGNI